MNDASEVFMNMCFIILWNGNTSLIACDQLLGKN